MLIHEILPVGLLQCNCSIFGDEKTHEAIVIDPGDDIDDILAVLGKHQLTVKAIVITHAHIDHIGGAAKLKAATGAPVMMNAQDRGLYDQLELQATWLAMPNPERTDIDVELKEGDVIEIGERPVELKDNLGSAKAGLSEGLQGDARRFEILHTPGHTQGSISLWIPAENKLIAGDTLFRDSIGRTDLPGGNSREILRSIKNKLLTLPDDAIVIPGHGANTTIARERQRNPFLQGL